MKRIACYIVALFALLLSFSFLGDGAHAQQGVAGAGNKAIVDLAGCTASNIPANDDGSGPQVPIGFPLNFFGTSYSSLYVNNNGNVTFDAALAEYTPFDLTSTAQVIIAPYFADVDTRAAGSGLATYGATTFFGRPAFCVNWVNVGYYAVHLDKQNSFQLLLVDRSDIGTGDFDIIFNYDKIQWETGDALSSGGSGGLGGHSARAGYTNGVDTSLELPGSAINSAFLDSTPSGLIHGSRGTTQHGRYIFTVRGGAAPTGGSISGTVYGEPSISGSPATQPLAGAVVSMCLTGTNNCLTQTSDALGHYQFSGLAAGKYASSAFPPADRADLFPGALPSIDLPADSLITGQDHHLLRPSPPPPGVSVGNIGTTSTGAPIINWAGDTPISKTNTPGCTGTFQLIKDGVVIRSGNLTESSPGLYKGTITQLLPQHGPATLRFISTCPNPANNKTTDVDVYIDPSGTVRTVGGAPIEGATVTLYYTATLIEPFEVVADGSAIMSPSNRTNPDLTDAEGYFHWDVIAGYYKVRAAKTGCHNPANAGQLFVETIVMQIPPPVTDLDLRLDCGGGPQPTSTPPSGIEFGNVNCVGGVNSIDAALVLQYSASLITSLACQAAAHVNGDGVINSIDAALILQFVSGLLSHLPV